MVFIATDICLKYNVPDIIFYRIKLNNSTLKYIKTVRIIFIRIFKIH